MQEINQLILYQLKSVTMGWFGWLSALRNCIAHYQGIYIGWEMEEGKNTVFLKVLNENLNVK